MRWQGLVVVCVLMAACGGSVLAWNTAEWPEASPPAPLRRLPPTSQATPAARVDTVVVQSAWDPDRALLMAAPSQSSNPIQDLQRRVAELEALLQDQAIEKAAARQKAASRPTTKVGGRILTDFANFNQSPLNMNEYGDIQDGCEFRSARMKVYGDYENISYIIEMDFSGIAPNEVADPGVLTKISFRHVYLQVNDLPWLGHVRIGHYKEPISLEELTSRLDISLMERSIGMLPFTPKYNLGVMAFDHSENERATWAVGAFKAAIPSSPPIHQNDNAGVAGTVRLTWLPLADDPRENRRLLHTGAIYSYRHSDDKVERFRGFPNSRLAPYMVDTKPIPGLESWQLLGGEAAVVFDSFHIQSEYLGTWVHRPGRDDLSFYGAYLTAGYFLTGEHRPYKRSAGKFGRVKPLENFYRYYTDSRGIINGLGAWQVVYRCSYTYLNDAGVWGGRAVESACGVNWYLNPYARIMFDYANAHISPDTSPMSDINIFDMRVQVSF